MPLLNIPVSVTRKVFWRLCERQLAPARLPSIALALLLLLVPASHANAQATGSATLRGTVKDAQGSLITQARVNLTNENTHDRRTTITNGEGEYVFSAVSPGLYIIKAESSGFRTYEETGIAIGISDSLSLDIRLEVGAANETISITASAAPIRKENGAMETTISAGQIDNLSIISRSPLELLRTLPGVAVFDPLPSESIRFGYDGTVNYNINGLRNSSGNITLDGARMNDAGGNSTSLLNPNSDMVQEVKVQTSNYAPEFGSGVNQISVITKSGGSQFHGVVYDYLRDYRFSASDRSNNYAGLDKPQSNYQYPGGNIGGPLLIPGTAFNKGRDKLFFFVGFEAQRQKIDIGTSLAVVPTLKQRQGDFSELLNIGGQNLNQLPTVNIPGGFPDAGSPAPNNDLSPYIDPVGRALINLYPLPNYDDSAGRYNYAINLPQPVNRNQAIARFDYNISDNTKLYVRLAREVEHDDYARGLWWASSNYELPSHVIGTGVARSAAISLTSILGQTITNEVLFSASGLKGDNDYEHPEKVSLQALGIGSFRGMLGHQSDYAPVAIWSGQGLGDLFNAGGLPLFEHQDRYSVTDNLTKVYASHLMKFGGFVEQANRGNNEAGFNACVEGCISLGSGWTPGGTGNDFGDLLVGRPAQFDQTTKLPANHFRNYSLEAYAQDSWKVRANLTLEYGARLAYLPVTFERNGLGILFDPKSYDRREGLLIGGDPRRPNGILLASRHEIPKSVTRNPAPQWAPRLSFAWDITGRGETVIRGGAGLFYNRTTANYQTISASEPPNAYSASVNAFTGLSLGGGQGLTFNSLREVDPYTSDVSYGITSPNPDSIHIPRIVTMSLSVARRLPLQQVLEVAYVGTQGRHLPNVRDINFIPPGTLLSGQIGNADLSVPINRVALDSSVITELKPFPAYSSISLTENEATSTYHSLQVTLSRQAGKSLQYFATYTFSKAMGTISSDNAQVDPIDARGKSYGVLDYDRTHIFNLSYNYNLPDLARGIVNSRAGRLALNGWQLSGITTFQSGQPIRLSFSGDIASPGIAQAFFGTDAYRTTFGGEEVRAIAPVFLRDPFLGNQNHVGGRLIDIDAISIPAFGQSGPYESPYYIRNPNFWNSDLSLFKNFKFSEERKLQFRAGVFNVFNQAYPDPNQGDIDLTLETTCNVRRSGIPNGAGGTVDGVCDPTQGFSFTPQTIENFGKVRSKHGHRIVQFALKFYF